MTGDEHLVGALCAAARDRQRVRYRIGGRVAVGTLVYYPGVDRRRHNDTQRASSRKAKVLTGTGRYLSVDPTAVEVIDPDA